MEFQVIDTGGLEEIPDDNLKVQMMQQTEKALNDVDVALFLIDSRQGVLIEDEHFARYALPPYIPPLTTNFAQVDSEAVENTNPSGGKQNRGIDGKRTCDTMN